MIGKSRAVTDGETLTPHYPRVKCKRMNQATCGGSVGSSLHLGNAQNQYTVIKRVKTVICENAALVVGKLAGAA